MSSKTFARAGLAAAGLLALTAGAAQAGQLARLAQVPKLLTTDALLWRGAGRAQ